MDPEGTPEGAPVTPEEAPVEGAPVTPEEAPAAPAEGEAPAAE